MFDFFKEVIINSATLPREEGINASGEPFSRFCAITPSDSNSKEGVFRVLRCADYVKSGIKGGKIYKTAGRRGEVAEVTFNMNSLSEVGQYRVLVDISLEGRYYSDYKYPWSEFHKPIMAEFDLVSGMDSQAKADAVVKALKSYIPSDYKYAVASVENGEVKLTMSDPYQIVKTAKIQKVEEDGCLNGCSGVKYEDVLVASIKKNVAPFGTGEWLVENLRFPTYPNLRYAGVNDDEKPISGALYTQFAFEYCSPRRGLHGQGTVGQALVSVTHHVFYVLNDLVDAFEGAISEAFGKDVSIYPITPVLTILNAGEGEPGTMVVKAADVNAGTVSLKATYSDSEVIGMEVEEGIEFKHISGPFKVVQDKDTKAWTLNKDTAEVTAGAEGVIAASYKDAYTTIKVIVE